MTSDPEASSISCRLPISAPVTAIAASRMPARHSSYLLSALTHRSPTSTSCAIWNAMIFAPADKRGAGVFDARQPRGTESSQTLRWRELDSNLPYMGAVILGESATYRDACRSARIG